MGGEKGEQGIIGMKGSKGEIGEKGNNFDGYEMVENCNNMLLEMQKTFTETINSWNQRISDLEIPKTCNEVKSNVSGLYLIQPTPTVLPFRVHCNFSGDQVLTVIGHDSEEETVVKGRSGPRSYRKDIKYDNKITLEQIGTVINASQSCKQFIKYRCHQSILLKNHNAAWVSRDGVSQYRWGSSDQDDYCECGISGTCVDTSFKCNCDARSNSVQFDEGFITDMDKLPVRKLYFGDTYDNGSWGYHTLGKLICM